MKKPELYIVTIIFDGEQNVARPFTSIEDIRIFLEEYAVLTESDPNEYIKNIPSIGKMKKALEGEVKHVEFKMNKEYLNITKVEMAVVDVILKPYLEIIASLRNTIRPMIGHPENPFDENHLQEQVSLADEVLASETKYYAVYSCEVSDYLIYGLNFTDKEKVREDLLHGNKNHKDFEKMETMNLEELCAHLNCELHDDTQPF